MTTIPDDTKEGNEPPNKEATLRWWEEIVDRLKSVPELESLEPFLDFANMPPWASRAAAEFHRQGYPGLQFDKLRDPGPNELGSLLGQQAENYWALGSHIETIVERSKVDRRIGEFVRIVQRMLAENPEHPGMQTVQTLISVTDVCIQQLPEHVEDFTETLTASFRSAVEQPNYEEALTFFRGFASGLAKQGFKNGKSTASTTAAPIYFMLSERWRELERFRTVNDLH